jgi:hypothetical protein
MTTDNTDTRKEWIEERDHIEDVLCRRFHFLILFFSAVIGGALATRCRFERLLILWPGTVVTALLAMTVRRADCRLTINMSHIYDNFRDHPATQVRQRIKESLWGARCYGSSSCVMRLVNLIRGGFSVSECPRITLVLVILSAAKNLVRPHARSFAALRMTVLKLKSYSWTPA